VYVKILNQKTNKEIEFGTPAEAQQAQKKLENMLVSEIKIKALISRCENEGVDVGKIMKLYKVNSLADLTEKKYAHINVHWEDIKKA
jgi:tRNA 2-selenouridine synthase SelU